MAIALGLALILAWPLYNVLLIVLSWRGTTPAKEGTPAPDTGRPTAYWLVVPCLNEERVVARTVKAALALRSPGAAVHVLAVDDGSDDGTAAALHGIAHPRLRVLRREPPAARRGKGAALNAAYRMVSRQVANAGGDPHRTVIGVIDADGRGSANLLEEVSGFLADDTIDAVQCRVRITNRNRLLGALQDLEFGSVVNGSQVLRDAVGSVGLGGNAQFARLSALRRLGDAPWSDCLVEDMELGLRLHLGRARLRYASRASVRQQGVVDPRRLLRQRTRWAQGNLQCVRYLPQLVSSPRIRNSAFLELLHYLLAPWVNALGTLAVAGLWGYAAWRLLDRGGTGWPLLAAMATVAVAATLLPGLMWGAVHWWRLRDERLSRCLAAGAAYPLFLVLGLVSTWRAVGRQLAGRNSWVKTERLIEEPAW